MKTFLTIGIILLLVGCSTRLGFVESVNSAKITAESPTLFSDVLNIDGRRNLVYIFDPTCSVCQAEYMAFSKYAGICFYDSLTTIVVNSDDMLLMNFYHEKDILQRPKHENVVYDSNAEISRMLYLLSRGRNVLLFEDRKLIFCCNMQDYMFMDDKDIKVK